MASRIRNIHLLDEEPRATSVRRPHPIRSRSGFRSRPSADTRTSTACTSCASIGTRARAVCASAIDRGFGSCSGTLRQAPNSTLSCSSSRTAGAASSMPTNSSQTSSPAGTPTSRSTTALRTSPIEAPISASQEASVDHGPPVSARAVLADAAWRGCGIGKGVVRPLRGLCLLCRGARLPSLVSGLGPARGTSTTCAAIGHRPQPPGTRT